MRIAKTLFLYPSHTMRRSNVSNDVPAMSFEHTESLFPSSRAAIFYEFKKSYSSDTGSIPVGISLPLYQVTTSAYFLSDIRELNKSDRGLISHGSTQNRLSNSIHPSTFVSSNDKISFHTFESLFAGTVLENGGSRASSPASLPIGFEGQYFTAIASSDHTVGARAGSAEPAAEGLGLGETTDAVTFARSESMATNGMLTVSSGGTAHDNSFVNSNSSTKTISGAPTGSGSMTVASGSTLVISNDITSSYTGTITINAGATLELTGSVSNTVTIAFAGGDATLKLDQPSLFAGSITGLTAGGLGDLNDQGDTIDLTQFSPSSGTGIYYAAIGTQNNTRVLEIQQGYPSRTVGNYVTTGSAIDYHIAGDLSDDFFNVSSSGSDTLLTLTNGNPIDIALNAYNLPETGAGITIGVISSYTGKGENEGAAISQIIKDIAPDAHVDVMLLSANGSKASMAKDILALANSGANIILDDISFGSGPQGEQTSGSSVDKAIDEVVTQMGVSYFTAADNQGDRYPVYGHAADPHAITVGAVNWLAAPQPAPVGQYLSVDSEPYSAGNLTGKPNISAPDGGPVAGFSLSSNAGLDPFFGTSAAVPAAAAVAALMMQANATLKTNPAEIADLLEESAVPFGNHAISGAGLIQANSAVALALHAACYCDGTSIKTKYGATAVECLRIGDEVETPHTTPRPIKWIGHRKYAGRFIIGNDDILPVCFQAGSLGDNVPARDLRVSPHHAMYLDGFLIEAKDLINGVSITQDKHVASVTYFHIELETHDVILAEGAWSETFIDDDNRGLFHNAYEFAELYPCEKSQFARYCAPRIDCGFELEDIRRKLLKRAAFINRAA